MPARSFAALLLLFWYGATVRADDPDDLRLAPPQPPLDAEERAFVGGIVCGPAGFEPTDTGLRCRVCPPFTGQPGAREGLEIGNALHGRFTGSPEEELLLDTDGCEAHFASFGGAILLGRPQQKGGAGRGAEDPEPMRLLFYQPGLRLRDCLVLGQAAPRAVLACNEADMTQGEVIGHVSIMEVSRREITRWRLLRWLDNTASDSSRVVSVLPLEMDAEDVDDDGRAELVVGLRIIETTRTRYEGGDAGEPRELTLVFHRKGQRFLAGANTQKVLEEIHRLTGGGGE